MKRILRKSWFGFLVLICLFLSACGVQSLPTEEETFTVVWKNADGTILETDGGVTKNTIPVFNGTTPGHADSEQFEFSFSGWEPSIQPTTQDRVYTATFNSQIKTFTVTWKNHDGTVLETDEQVPYGSLPEYDGSIPRKISGESKFAFISWTDAEMPVTGNQEHFAQYLLVGDEWEYELSSEENSYSITGNTDDEATFLFVPPNIDGLPVTEIGNRAFASMDNLIVIGFPSSLEKIGDFAFQFCDSLETVTLPDSLTQLGTSSFANCHSLVSITLGNGLQSIGEDAFMYCGSLGEITLPASLKTIGIGAFTRCASLESIFVDEDNPHFSSLNGLLFDKNQTVLFEVPGAREQVTLPSTVEVIREAAFGGSADLTSVQIPDSVHTIQEFAFSGCTALSSIIIPISVTQIGSNGLSGSGTMTIYCRASAKPTGWHVDWCRSDAVIVWGYNG